MAIATLDAIIKKVRKLTVSMNSNQLLDSDIIDYINSFYLYDFPAEFRSLDLKNTYTFNTIQGVDTYAFDYDHWINLQAPAYVAKRAAAFFTEPESFYYYNYYASNYTQQIEKIGTGDAAETNFTATLQKAPIIRSVNNNPIVDTQTTNTQSFPSGYPPTFSDSNISRIQNLLITANVSNGTTLNVTDDGAGNLIGDIGAGTNTVNYNTGAIDVTFSSAPGSSEEVNVEYNPVTLNMPISVLLYQNQLVLRPVPDKGYIVEIQGYRSPSQALMGTTSTTVPNLSGRPELLEWWETIAYGAAKKIYEDRIDMEGVAMMEKMLQERYQLNFTRTYAQMGKKRIATIYSDDVNYTNTSGPYGLGFGGQ